MKYKDKNITIEADSITIYDTDRPAQALTNVFNPVKNSLIAQSQGLINRVTGILHEYNEPINFGIADVRLHCLMPILIYSRPPLEDEYFSLSNNLVIQDNQLAKDLLVGAGVKFYSESKLLLDGIFSNNKFSTLVFQINDEETIYTAIDKLSTRKGMLFIHNPEYKNTTPIMKYCLDRNLHLIENLDGSAEILRF